MRVGMGVMVGVIGVRVSVGKRVRVIVAVGDI